MAAPCVAQEMNLRELTKKVGRHKGLTVEVGGLQLRFQLVSLRGDAVTSILFLQSYGTPAATKPHSCCPPHSGSDQPANRPLLRLPLLEALSHPLTALQAVQLFTCQLLIALRHLFKNQVLHSDIKVCRVLGHHGMANSQLAYDHTIRPYMEDCKRWWGEGALGIAQEWLLTWSCHAVCVACDVASHFPLPCMSLPCSLITS